jgi:copper oxidase (laccase) domain-containing protein
MEWRKKRVKQLEKLVEAQAVDRLNEKEESQYIADFKKFIEAYLNDEEVTIDFIRYYKTNGQCKYKLPNDFFSQYSTEELRKLAESNL